MKTVSAATAVEAIPAQARVILPHGAIEPATVYQALPNRLGRGDGLTLYSGLQFGSYSFLEAGVGESFRYVTWQASSKLRDFVRGGIVDFLPMRYRDVVRIVRRGGQIEPDVVIVQVTPPRRGVINLGIACSFYRDLIASAHLVIAEIHPDMPWTRGQMQIDVADIDLAVEAAAPLGTYRSPRQSTRDARIVDFVLGLIPDGAWVQLGVGAIPDSLLPRLHEIAGVSLFSGMLTEGLIDFLAKANRNARVVTGEVAGSADLYAAVKENPRVEFQPTTITHDLFEIAKLPRFVSVNSAVEVDLQGQINGETIDGVQISGVGGSLDFVEGAAYSPGGMSVVALASTTEDGRRSKIVPSLSAETPVTIPRYCTDVIVTENGIARLRGRTLRQRAEALVEIAHPNFRATLAAVVR